MVAGFTRDREGWNDVAPALAKLTAHRDALLTLTDRDAEAYAAVGAAYKLQKSNEAEKSARLDAIQDALKASAQVPLAVIHELSEAVTVLPVLLESGNRNLVSDVGVAADFAQSALRCAWLNVEINLNRIKDEEYKTSIRQSMEEMISKAENIAADVWDQTVDLVTQEE